MHRLLRYLLIAGLGNLLFLFASKDFCNDYPYCPFTFITAEPGGIPISINVSWDSFEFIDCARQPSLLLEPDNPRQSRPLFIALGSAMGFGVWYATWPWHTRPLQEAASSRPSFASTDPAVQRTERLCFLAGFILINLLILIACCWLFEELLRLLGLRPAAWLRNGMLFALTVNQLTKLFFWSAHTQLFLLLVPLICLYGFIRLSRSTLRTGAMLQAGFFGGAGLLLYGSFLLLLPSMLLGLLRNRQNRRPAAALTLSLSFMMPTIIWILFLRSRGGQLFSQEISRYRQFIWISDSWKVSPATLARQAWTNLARFAETWWILTGALFIGLGWLLIRSTKRYAEIRSTNRNSLPQPSPGASAKQFLREGLLPVFVITLVFTWAIGYYADRLTYGLVPFILLAIAADLSARKLVGWQRMVLVGSILVCWLCTWLYDLPHLGSYYYI